MIARISGQLIYKSPESIIVDVGGVGYELLIPLSTYYRLPPVGERVQLLAYTHVREDALQLYGFFTFAEKELFGQLISVSKVGPRLARNILSGLPAEELKQAIILEDIAAITAIPGIGRKMAERLVVELKDKLTRMVSEAEQGLLAEAVQHKDKVEDLVSALVNLGYKSETAKAAARKTLQELGAESKLDELIKQALNFLVKH